MGSAGIDTPKIIDIVKKKIMESKEKCEGGKEEFCFRNRNFWQTALKVLNMPVVLLMQITFN